MTKKGGMIMNFFQRCILFLCMTLIMIIQENVTAHEQQHIPMPLEMQSALSNRNFATLKKIFSRQPELVESCDQSNFTSLAIAAGNHDHEMLKFLLSHGANELNIQTKALSSLQKNLFRQLPSRNDSKAKVVMIVGAGYVGLVTGVCFAAKNNTVIIVENNLDKVAALLMGRVPFYEPGLDALLKSCIDDNRLIFIKSIKEGLAYSPDIIFSCVGTPPLSDGSADLSQVFNVAHEIGKNIQNYSVVVNKSTVPVGTTRRIKDIIKQEFQGRGTQISFDVASNPEFLKEGEALDDFLYPDRIVIGTESERACQILKDLYQPFLLSSGLLLTMNIESAELAKYASNGMLATRISFMNQLARLATKVGACIDDIKKAMAKDRRIGEYFLNAGIGYGGSCFPKDVTALVHMGKEYNESMSLVHEVDAINSAQRTWFIDLILKAYNYNLTNTTIGIWGLAFKPETDDIRCAPSIDTITMLLKYGARIIVYDPVASKNIQSIFGDTITYAQNASQVLEASHALVILTDWKQFRQTDYSAFRVLKDKIVFDGRNCFDPAAMRNVGITYVSIGRPTT